MNNRVRAILPETCFLLSQRVNTVNQQVYNLEKDLSISGIMNSYGIINVQYLNAPIVCQFRSAVDTYNQLFEEYQNCAGVVTRERMKVLSFMNDGSLRYIK